MVALEVKVRKVICAQRQGRASEGSEQDGSASEMCFRTLTLGAELAGKG